MIAAFATLGGSALQPSVAAASGPVLQSFAVPSTISSAVGAMQDAIVAGPDGQEWFAVNPGEDNVDYRLVEVNAAGTFTQLPADLGGTGPGSGIDELLTVGSDVYALSPDERVTHINSAGDLVQNFAGASGVDMTLGSDGNLYIADSRGDIERLVPGQSEGTLITDTGTRPAQILAVGNTLFLSDTTMDGLWTVSLGGAVAETDDTIGAAPHAMTVGPDGDLWSVGQGVNGNVGTTIERIDPSNAAVLETYTPPQSAYVLSLTTGPDGRLWFPMAGLTHAIGALDPATGTFSVYPLPAGFDVTVQQQPNGNNFPPVTDVSTIAPGPDDTLWVTGETDTGAPAVAEISQIVGSSAAAPAPVAPAPAPRPTTRARITARAASRVTRGGVITVALRCAGTGTCRGGLSLVRSARRGRRPLARASYRVAAGHRRLMRLRLSQRGRRLLDAARGHRLAVRLRVSPRGGPARSRRLLLHTATASRHR